MQNALKNLNNPFDKLENALERLNLTDLDSQNIDHNESDFPVTDNSQILSSSFQLGAGSVEQAVREEGEEEGEDRGASASEQAATTARDTWQRQP